MITVNSPIIGRADGHFGEAMAWAKAHSAKRLSEVNLYLDVLTELCLLVGFDFRILAAQSAHETANWTSDFWERELNPAGIGKFDDGSSQSIVYQNGGDAARAHVVHMAAYALFRNSSHLVDGISEMLNEFQVLDPRYSAVFDAGFAGTVKVLGDLGNGKWATDPKYAEKIAAKANLIFKEEPVPEQSVVFGRVPKPPIIDLICPKPYEGAGFYRVAPRQNVGVCEHITAGRGSIEFYHQFFSTGGERAADALVDFVIGRDGRIAMLNDWRGTRAPWANGNKLGMEGDGPAFYQEFGVAGIDQMLVSIEHEGIASEDWTGAMWNAAVALDAWLFDQMGVRFDSFPVHQDYGVVTHMLHSEFTNKGGNLLDECPGRYLKQRIDSFQSDIKSVLMAHQIVSDSVPTDPPKPPVDLTPKPFPGFKHGRNTGTDQHVNGTTYQYLNRLFRVAPDRKAQKRISIGKDALVVSVLPEGTKVRSAFVVRINDLDWMVDEEGYSYQFNAFTPKVALPLKPRK